MLHRRFSRKKSRISIEKEEFFEKANLLRSEIDHEWTLIEALHNKIEGYGDLKNVVERLSQSLSVRDTAEALSKETMAFFHRDDVTLILYLIDRETASLGIAVAQHNQQKTNIKSKSGDVFDMWTLKHRQPLLVEDAKRDFRFDIDQPENMIDRPIRSLMSVPLSIADHTLGVLRLDSAVPKKFSTEDLRFLRTIGDLGSIAIENARLYERIENLAIKDDLTGLYLRRYLMTRLEQEISREMRIQEEFSFIMIDIDYFKKYNDEYGHMAGDIVLKTIGGLLKEHFKDPGSVVSRYGGEEFSVLMPHCSKVKAVEQAEAIRQKIANHEIMLRRQKTSVTISIGVASFPQDARLKDELIQMADKALYKAKKDGRNRVVQAGEE